jgi:hypothetical protein
MLKQMTITDARYMPIVKHYAGKIGLIDTIIEAPEKVKPLRDEAGFFVLLTTKFFSKRR